MDLSERFSPMDLDQPRARGLEDGMAQRPPSTSSTPEGYAQELIGETRISLMALTNDWNRRRDKADEEVRQKKSDRDGVNHERTHLLEELKRERDHLTREREGDDSKLSDAPQTAWRKARNACDEAKRALDEFSDGERGRRLKSRLSPLAYVCIMLVLAVLEYPINLQGTGLILPGRDSAFMVFILTSLLSAALISSAHLGGRLLKQKTLLGLRGLPQTLVWVGAGMMALLSLTAIGYVRYRWLKSQDQLDVTLELSLFLFINAGVFFTGLITALLHYDPDSDFQSRTYAHARAVRRLGGIEARFIRRESGLELHFNTEMKRLNNKRDRLSAELQAAQERRQGLDSERALFIRTRTYWLAARLTAYAEANRSQRRGMVLPGWLEAQGIAHIQQSLKDEFCRELGQCADH